ncbi:hypothetical protein Taro_023790 [Colocasia esculenta]|uniref:Uncharacterized protein n=1 Tax=Colocasia esculenta TaxID=4460 RepID=A0A843VCH9_COLES|nr:hypothetical protein [Colocasia esculenta]
MIKHEEHRAVRSEAVVKLKLAQVVRTPSREEVNPSLDLATSTSRKLSSIWNAPTTTARSALGPPSTNARHAVPASTCFKMLAPNMVQFLPSTSIRSI